MLSKKMFIFPCVFLCVFMLFTSPTFAQKGTLSLSPASIESPGVGGQLEFSLDITGGQNVAGYQVTVQFDTSALKYVSGENADYLAAGAFFLPPEIQGNRVELVSTSLAGESQGNGTLAKVTFEVVAAKASTLTLPAALLSNSQGQTAAPQQFKGAEITEPLPVSIPDAALANAIRTQLELSANADITTATMRGLTQLSAEDSGISDLTGLEHATNLQYHLFLRNNEISDITPLENLIQLQGLYLSDNPISDLQPLENLIQLQSLELANTQISDITPLKNLIQLQWLQLSNTQISNLQPLENLIRLQSLYLFDNEISDITPLENLKQLQSLQLPNNEISDITPLKNLTQLQGLGLSGNEISDLQPLENLTNLQKLYLRDNQITDVTPLAQLVNLQTLFLSGNPSLRDISPLADLYNQLIEKDFEIKRDVVSIPNAALANAIRTELNLNADADITTATMRGLTQLSAEDSGISDLTGLEHATNLQTLYLRRNQISDLTPISRLVNLQALYLGFNDISDLTPIPGLTELRELYLRDNRISDVTPLGALVNLEILHLAGNPLRDTSPLASLQLKGKDFEITGAPKGPVVIKIKTFPEDPVMTPILIPDTSLRAALRDTLGLNPGDNITQEAMQTLTSLKAEELGISDLTGLEHATNLQTLELRRNQISDLTPLKNLKNLQALYLGFNDISDLTPISGLINLWELGLYTNQISDLTPISGLVNLRELYLRDNEISDVSPLVTLVNLEILHLTGNPLGDTSALAGLYNQLKDPDFKIARLSDGIHIRDAALANAIRRQLKLGPGDRITLAVMLKLEGLGARRDPGGGKITDLDGLEHAINLDYLDLRNHQITNITPLENLRKLETLIAGNNQITDITPLQRLTNLQNLHLDLNRISNLQPLRNLTRLEALGLLINQITDITPLENLTNLTSLRLSSNKISNLQPLKNLTRLEILDLSSNQITDVTPLAQLTNLRYLHLIGNPLGDTSALADLKRNGTDIDVPITAPASLSLTPELASAIRHTLDLPANVPITTATMRRLTKFTPFKENIKNLNGLEHAINLEVLSVGYDLIEDLTPLKNLTKLQGLSLYHTPIRDITSLENLTELQSLSLSNNEIEDITPLKNLKKLVWLNLSDNQITDVTPLAGLTNLHTLYLGKNPNLRDYSPLTGLYNQLREKDFKITDSLVSIPDAALAAAIKTALGLAAGDDITQEAMQTLTSLKAEQRGISNLTGLEHAINLQTLELRRNQISDLTPISRLTNLQELYLGFNDISDLTPISRLTNLQELGLYTNQISDLTPISGLVNLRELYLRDNQIRDVTPLVALVNLEILHLEGNPLGDTSPLANLQLKEKDFEITEPGLPADVNKDGIVNVQDLVLVGSNFGKTGTHDADINGDGIINIADLVLVAGAFGTGKSAAPILHASVLDTLTAADVQVWLSQAQHLDTTDPVSEKGIRFLVQLLAVLTPKDTVLLPNYPNPFNPETWIPYHLATATDVQITIYDATGSIVRRLDLGHQPAGYYTDRSRAAYWDGRNATGERVASGVYFYQLETARVSLLRKLVILK